jgi:hypothetical protein
MPSPTLLWDVSSTNLAEICASDGFPGSAYSRAHRATTKDDRRAGIALVERDHLRLKKRWWKPTRYAKTGSGAHSIGKALGL